MNAPNMRNPGGVVCPAQNVAISGGCRAVDVQARERFLEIQNAADRLRDAYVEAKKGRRKKNRWVNQFRRKVEFGIDGERVCVPLEIKATGLFSRDMKHGLEGYLKTLGRYQFSGEYLANRICLDVREMARPDRPLSIEVEIYALGRIYTANWQRGQHGIQVRSREGDS